MARERPTKVSFGSMLKLAYSSVFLAFNVVATAMLAAADQAMHFVDDIYAYFTNKGSIFGRTLNRKAGIHSLSEIMDKIYKSAVSTTAHPFILPAKIIHEAEEEGLADYTAAVSVDQHLGNKKDGKMLDKTVKDEPLSGNINYNEELRAEEKVPSNSFKPTFFSGFFRGGNSR